MPSAKKGRFTEGPTVPLHDPENACGKAYADSLRLKAKALISGLVMPRHARESVASDLETLAHIAEHHPEAFAGVPTKTR